MFCVTLNFYLAMNFGKRGRLVVLELLIGVGDEEPIIFIANI